VTSFHVSLPYRAAWWGVLGAAALLLTACAGNPDTNAPQPVGDRAYRQLRAAADASLTEEGDAHLALGLYTQALERAQATLNPEAIAQASFGRAASLARLRRYDAALQALDTPGNAAPPSQRRARWLLAARIHMEQGDVEKAAELLGRAEAAITESTRGATRTLIRLTRGQLAAMARDTAAAQQALVDTERLPSPGLQAQRHRLAGMVATLENNHAQAAAAHLSEASAARRAANWPAAAEATARAASAYSQADDPASAAALYLQAGRSASLQKHAELPGQEWLKDAINAANIAGRPEITEAASELLTPE